MPNSQEINGEKIGNRKKTAHTYAYTIRVNVENETNNQKQARQKKTNKPANRKRILAFLI